MSHPSPCAKVMACRPGLYICASLARMMRRRYWLPVPTDKGLEFWPHKDGHTLSRSATGGGEIAASFAIRALGLKAGDVLEFQSKRPDGRVCLVRSSARDGSSPSHPLGRASLAQTDRSNENKTSPPQGTGGVG